MALLYDNQTGQYLDLPPAVLQKLAYQNPNLNAQNVAVNGVGAIRVNGVTPNLLAVPKTGVINVWVGYGVLSGGVDGYQRVSVSAGQPIGITTGNEATWTSTTEIKLSVALGGGKYPAGSTIWVTTNDIALKAPSSGGGGGGNLLFPIALGSRNEAVMKFQQWLINCGYNLGASRADGAWGSLTQTAAIAEGITSINSESDLNRIISGSCKKQGGGGNNQGGGGGGENPPIDPIPVVTTSQDNTILYVVGAIGLALLLKNKGRNKKKKGK